MALDNFVQTARQHRRIQRPGKAERPDDIVGIAAAQLVEHPEPLLGKGKRIARQGAWWLMRLLTIDVPIGLAIGVVMGRLRTVAARHGQNRLMGQRRLCAIQELHDLRLAAAQLLQELRGQRPFRRATSQLLTL